MNIIVNARFSGKKTGIGRLVEQLFNHLQDIDHENSYFIYVNLEFVDLFPIRNPKFHIISNGIPGKSMLKNHLWTLLGFQREVIRRKGDIVVMPGITLILYKFAKTIYFQNDLIEYHIPNQKWYKLLFRRIAFPLAIKLADRVVAISENTRRDVRNTFNPPEHKLEVVFLGVDTEAFKPVPTAEAKALVAAKYGITNEFILYTGTITHPQKNLLNLLEGFALARAAGRTEVLVLVGNPGKDAHLVDKKILELDLGACVTLTGYVPDADQPAFYSAARVFCFPSFYEGFGLPVLEAMACGCPVVTSNVSSLPEVAGDAAILVSPESVEAIGKAILDLLTDGRLRESLIEKGHAQAQRLSWKASAQTFHRIIRDLGKS